jgi:hypothetical protein
MCSTVQRPVKRNLHHPILYRALGSIEQEALPVEVEKALLDNVFGFTPVAYHSKSDPKNQPGISVKQSFQRRGIVCLQTVHGFLVARYA